jgi:hypothetical protein
MSEDLSLPSPIADLILLSKSVITKLGIQNYKTQPSTHKCRILFSITNMGQSTDSRWSTFPVIIDVEADFVKIYIVFTFEGRPYSFEADDVRTVLLRYLAVVNFHHGLSMLKFASVRKTARFESCFAFPLVNRCFWHSMLYTVLLNALSSYRTFGFGLVKIVDKTENIGSKDLGGLYDACYARTANKTPVQKPKTADVKPNEVFCVDKAEELIPVKAEALGKIRGEGLEQLFDCANLQEFQDGKLFYDNSRMKDIEFAIEKSLIVSMEILGRLKNAFLLLFSKGMTFSRMPLGLIKIVVHGGAVTDFLFGFKNIDLAMANETVSLAEYKISLWKEITRFNAALFSSKIHLEKHVSRIEMLDLKMFEQKRLDDRANFIGTGGFGHVFVNKYCGVDVAIKFASQRKEDRIASAERLKHEYFVTKALRHPHILSVYGCVKYKNTLGYVMQYCDNGTLSRAIKENQFPSRKQKRKLLISIASAISHMHSRNFVHLDIKPHNILLHKETPLLGDFGLSASLFRDVNTEMKLGCTIYYSPPEQIRNGPPRKSSDIWAFGMAMYQLIAGQHPFGFLRDVSKIEKENFYHLIKDSGVRPVLSEEICRTYEIESEIMRKCWLLDPGKRPKIEIICEQIEKALKEMEE